MQTNFLTEELPAWMRQPRRSTDWGVLLAALLGVMAAWTFLLREGVPAYTDLLHSGFMTADLNDALGEGQLMPRWSPHALSGYGAPVPNFVPQGAPMMAALAARLLTGDVASAMRLVMAGALIGASVAQYLFCRRWIGPSAALLAAGLYLFNPAVGLTTPHLAGDMPGTVGIALLPMGLWAASRAANHAARWDVALVAVIFAALFYTHPPLALAATLMGLALTLNSGSRAVARFAVGLVGAIGLFAPYWIPAQAEMGLVNWRPASEFAASASLAGLFAPLHPADPAILNPPPQYTLGVLLPIFALAGLVAQTISRGRQKRFAAVIAVSMLAAAVGIAATGQPWLITVLALCFAVLGGSAVDLRIRMPARFRRTVLPAALIFMLILSSGVWLPLAVMMTGDFSPLAQIAYEQSGYGTAILPADAPFPSTIRVGLRGDRLLIDSYQLPPLERVPLGSPVRVTPVSSGTHGGTWVVSTTAPNTLRLLLAYFAGWQADLDGQPVAVERDPVTGLVNILLPPTTNGTLRLWLGLTPERTAGWVAAFTTLIGLGLWTWRAPVGEAQNPPLLNLQETRLTAFALAFAGLGILASAVPGGALDLQPAPLNSLNGATAMTAESGEIRLLAYRLDMLRLNAGDTLPLTLYWSATAAPQSNSEVRITFNDIDRQTRTILSAPAAPGGLPTGRWQPDGVIIDVYALPLPENLAQGTYQIGIEMFDCTNGCNLNVPLRFRDAQGVARSVVALPTVVIIEP